jgi:hypothetical protein
MSECTYTLTERWDDCSDGACPFCLAARIKELEAERDAIEAATIERCRKAVQAIKWVGAEGVDALLKADEATSALAKPTAPDTLDIPEAGEEWFEKAKLVIPSKGD